MSSLQTRISQPKTRKYVVTQNALDGENGPRYFTQSDIDTWLSANGSKIQNLGDLFIIPGTTPGSTFVDVLTGSNGATILNTSGTYDPRKTLTDMGKQITIGDSGDSELLILRLVKTPSNSQTGQDFIVGYIPVENNASDLDNQGGRYMIRVARI
jgi:hypothetical protein